MNAPVSRAFNTWKEYQQSTDLYRFLYCYDIENMCRSTYKRCYNNTIGCLYSESFRAHGVFTNISIYMMTGEMTAHHTVMQFIFEIITGKIYPSSGWILESILMIRVMIVILVLSITRAGALLISHFHSCS